MKKTNIIGITGGLASGKTTVAKMFGDRGAVVIDADEIAHQLLMKEGPVRQSVIERFGAGILREGVIDRAKLRKRVFGEPDGFDSLNKILWPRIVKIIKEKAGKAGAPVVIDAPLLIESGFNKFVDLVVVVKAGREIKIKRAKDRGLTEEEAIRIMDRQMSDACKLEFADHVIDNGHDIKKTKQGVDKIWRKM